MRWLGGDAFDFSIDPDSKYELFDMVPEVLSLARGGRRLGVELVSV